MRNFSKIIQPLMNQGIKDLAELCRDADALVLACMSLLTGQNGVERCGLLFVAAFPMPISATGEQPNLLFHRCLLGFPASVFTTASATGC